MKNGTVVIPAVAAEVPAAMNEDIEPASVMPSSMTCPLFDSW